MIFTRFALLLLTAATTFTNAKDINLAPLWDREKPLANPYKGWYHHYYDNSLSKYLAKSDEELLAVPGLDHLYLRFAWSYLEPEEGKFNWHLIDDIVNKWSQKGVGFSLRISCRETGNHPRQQKFATPEWVREAGAKGGFFLKGREAKSEKNKYPWEPDYADPIFLAKVEAMIKALAKRYDGHPQLRYIDIGSLGDWGEGHTSSGSRRMFSAAVRTQHIKLHTRHFKKTPVITTDDLLRVESEEETAKLMDFALESKLGVRDDSIFVEYWSLKHPDTFSVSHPELFKKASRQRPTILETQHLRFILRANNWAAKPGSTFAKLSTNGPEFLTEATKLLRATYLGYHGTARQWLSLPENPKLSETLLNLSGYWYFPHQLTLPDSFRKTETQEVQIQWENQGLAPAYHPFQIIFRFNDDPSTDTVLEANNERWHPKQVIKETYQLKISPKLSSGNHSLSFSLYAPELSRPVHLPIKTASNDGFIPLGQISIFE